MLPDMQLVLRPGVIELSWGHPDLALLPVDDIARAAELSLRRDGSRALAYGAEQGPGRLLEPLAAWLARREATSDLSRRSFASPAACHRGSICSARC